MSNTFNLPVVDLNGKTVSQQAVPAALFGAEANEAALHFVCEGQRYRFYKKTACTKTRSAVRGGGIKARKQKGNGAGRQGGNRGPHWVGGGVVFGPSAIKHDFKLNRKVKSVALATLLSDRYSSGQIRVVKSDALKTPKTQSVSKLLESLSLNQGKVAFVVSKKDQAGLAKSARNIKNVQILGESQWTTLDFIKADSLIFSETALQTLLSRYEA